MAECVQFFEMNAVVKVDDANIEVIEYKGKRVVTLSKIDQVHGRVEGTARKRFNDNRDKFSEGKHYFEITDPSELRTLGFTRPQGGVPGLVNLITEAGYFLIIKSFQDQLAWDVYSRVVDEYFKKVSG